MKQFNTKQIIFICGILLCLGMFEAKTARGGRGGNILSRLTGSAPKALTPAEKEKAKNNAILKVIKENPRNHSIAVATLLYLYNYRLNETEKQNNSNEISDILRQKKCASSNIEDCFNILLNKNIITHIDNKIKHEYDKNPDIQRNIRSLLQQTTPPAPPPSANYFTEEIPPSSVFSSGTDSHQQNNFVNSGPRQSSSHSVSGTIPELGIEIKAPVKSEKEEQKTEKVSNSLDEDKNKREYSRSMNQVAENLDSLPEVNLRDDENEIPNNIDPRMGTKLKRMLHSGLKMIQNGPTRIKNGAIRLKNKILGQKTLKQDKQPSNNGTNPSSPRLNASGSNQTVPSNHSDPDSESHFDLDSEILINLDSKNQSESDSEILINLDSENHSDPDSKNHSESDSETLINLDSENHSDPDSIPHSSANKDEEIKANASTSNDKAKKPDKEQPSSTGHTHPVSNESDKEKLDWMQQVKNTLNNLKIWVKNRVKSSSSPAGDGGDRLSPIDPSNVGSGTGTDDKSNNKAKADEKLPDKPATAAKRAGKESTGLGRYFQDYIDQVDNTNQIFNHSHEWSVEKFFSPGNVKDRLANSMLLLNISSRKASLAMANIWSLNEELSNTQAANLKKYKEALHSNIKHDEAITNPSHPGNESKLFETFADLAEETPEHKSLGAACRPVGTLKNTEKIKANHECARAFYDDLKAYLNHPALQPDAASGNQIVLTKEELQETKTKLEDLARTWLKTTNPQTIEATIKNHEKKDPHQAYLNIAKAHAHFMKEYALALTILQRHINAQESTIKDLLNKATHSMAETQNSNNSLANGQNNNSCPNPSTASQGSGLDGNKADPDSKYDNNGIPQGKTIQCDTPDP